MENKIRTPKRQNEDTKTLMNEVYLSHFPINSEEQVKIYLAEIFTLNKKIEKLTHNIEENDRKEEIHCQKTVQLQNDIVSKEEKSKKTIEQLSTIIEDLKEKNRLLQKESEYDELITYYENKVGEYQTRNIGNIHMFSQAINKLMKDTVHNNKDEVWRNLIKKYEKKFEELENTIEQHEKNKRQIASRQKFFERYCHKAEEKFERVAKISNQYELKEKESNRLKQELNKFKEDYSKEHVQKEKIASDLVMLSKEHQVLKKFVNQMKINPLSKESKLAESKDKEEKWADIKKTNEENMKLLSYQQAHPISYDDRAIIILITNIKEYISILLSTKTPLTSDSSENLISILNDIENYTKMLFDKLHILLLNQSFIIDIVCDLSNQMSIELKKTKGKQDTAVNKILLSLKGTCSKLVQDYKPY